MMGTITDSSQTAFSRLQRRWWATAGFSLLLSAGAYLFLRAAWRPDDALRWLVIESAVMLYLLVVLRRGLRLNHRPEETMLLPGFGAGNWMTIARGMLIAGLAGFLFSPWPAGRLAWAPGMLYTLAALADFLDGYLARKTDHATRLGEALDLSFDSLGVLVAALLVVQYGQVQPWYLGVAGARYFFLAGLWLRRRLGKPVFELPPSVRRRAFAGLQMGFMFVILLPAFSPPATRIAAVLFALPFLAGFLYDWLVASGVVRASGTEFHPTWQRLKQALPLALRCGVVLLAALSAVRIAEISPAITAFMLQNNPARPELSVILLALAEAGVVILLALGAAGRLAGIAGLILLGIQQAGAGLTPAQVLLAAFYVGLLYLGTGALSLWTPEDRLIYRHAGERRPALSQALPRSARPGGRQA